MYAEGNNTSAIARILNIMKLPTKHQGKGWQQNTVAKTLKREEVYVEGRAKALLNKLDAMSFKLHTACPVSTL